MGNRRVHAFGDDALGDLDATALAELVATGRRSPRELAEAAIARAEAVEPLLHAIVTRCFERPRYADASGGRLHGVPTFVKDNTDVRGLPTTEGSAAFLARPAKRDGAYARQFLASGLTVLGKSRLPEFGFNASTEFMAAEPTRNPWHTGRTVGASSGGSAALVAAGVVPIAHANDGGGSIRIPAACAGLVGSKPSRGRHLDAERPRRMPINMVSEGVLTRTVRDTATFVAASEDYWRNPVLPPVGLVTGPANRRLRVGVVLESVVDAPLDAQTRDAVTKVAGLLEAAGHEVESTVLPVTHQFATDFLQYWGLLADLAISTGRFSFDRSFDRSRVDGLTAGLRRYHREHLARTPAAIRRLRAVPARYAELFARHELVLSPVVAHLPPPLGRLSPRVPFDELIGRLERWVAFTPLNNIAGTPAISVPVGVADEGVPIGVQLSAAYGDDRTLLETAYFLADALPFPKITDPALPGPAG